MATSRLTKAAGVSIAANAALVAVKSALAYLSGSVALQADAAHSGSDLVVSLLVLVSAWLARSGRSGLVRILETLLGLGVSFVILGTAYYFMSSASATAPQTTISYPFIALVGLLGCILATDALARYKIRIGEQEGSHAMVADGYHSRLDVYSSIAVFAAVFGQWRGIRLDAPVALAVSVMIALLGFELLAATVKSALSGTRFAQAGFVIIDILRDRGVLPTTGRRAVRIFAVLLGLIILVWGVSAFQTVKPWQTGIMLKFGALHGSELEPGLHIAPFPFYELETIDTKQVRIVEVGFRSGPEGAVPIPEEALCTCGDSNMVLVQLVVYYRVADAVKFRFGCATPQRFLKAEAEGAMRLAVARLSLDEILSGGRRRLNELILRALRKRLQQLDCGIELVAVRVREVKPPREVLESFREVFSAQEDLQTAVNHAQATSNSRLPKARGEAAQMIAKAEAYATERLLDAAAQATRLARIAEVFRTYGSVLKLELRRATVLQALENSSARRYLLDWRLKGAWLASTKAALDTMTPQSQKGGGLNAR